MKDTHRAVARAIRAIGGAGTPREVLDRLRADGAALPPSFATGAVNSAARSLERLGLVTVAKDTAGNVHIVYTSDVDPDDPRLDEREAKRDAKAVEKRQRAATRVAVRAKAQAIDEAIAETGKRHPSCKCDLRAGMTLDDIRGLGAGCTDPLWCCPRLDAVRRRTEA